jgi:hypothetical protein
MALFLRRTYTCNIDTNLQSGSNVQNRSIRHYLGVHIFASVAAITGDISWVPSRYSNRRWLNMLRYWNRLVNFENDRLTKLVFDHDYELSIDNWCSEIKSIMTLLNSLNTFRSKSTVDFKTAESKLKDLYILSGHIWWSAHLNSERTRRLKVVFRLKTISC